MKLCRGLLGLVLLLLPAAIAFAQPPPPPPPPPILEAVGFHLWAPSGLSMCPSQSPPFNHWDLREFQACEVPYELNPNIPSGPDPATVIYAVHEAVDRWSGEKPSHIQLEDMSGILADCPVKPGFDGRNCFAWDPTFDIFPGALAATTVWVDNNTGVYSEVDITFNALDYTWQGSPPACNTGNPYGIEAVMLHEVGHFLDLDHPNVVGVPAGCGNDDPNADTLMFSIYQDACHTDVHQADWDGLYQSEMSPNLPRYQYEWLGIETGAIDDHELECEARVDDLDMFDDGAPPCSWVPARPAAASTPSPRRRCWSGCRPPPTCAAAATSTTPPT